MGLWAVLGHSIVAAATKTRAFFLAFAISIFSDQILLTLAPQILTVAPSDNLSIVRGIVTDANVTVQIAPFLKGFIFLSTFSLPE